MTFCSRHLGVRRAAPPLLHWLCLSNGAAAAWPTGAVAATAEEGAEPPRPNRRPAARARRSRRGCWYWPPPQGGAGCWAAQARRPWFAAGTPAADRPPPIHAAFEVDHVGVARRHQDLGGLLRHPAVDEYPSRQANPQNHQEWLESTPRASSPPSGTTSHSPNIRQAVVRGEPQLTAGRWRVGPARPASAHDPRPR
jgi:hypothetical protein